MPYLQSLTERARALRQLQTRAESVLWSVLRRRGFMHLKFIRQKPLKTYIADFYCAELKLVIEIDGAIHRQTIDYDTERTLDLEQMEICIVRFTNEQVLHDLSFVLERLRNVVSALKCATPLNVSRE